MALPYKLIKSLTIDGETMGLDPDLGKMLTSRSKTASLSASSWLSTDAYTIPEDGMYLVGVTGTFGVATSTGATSRVTALKRNGGAPSYMNSTVEATNTDVTKNFIHFIYLTAGTTLQGSIMSGRASGSSTVWLEVTKLIKVS